MTSIVPYQLPMIRRRPPEACGVISGSTPVVSFGDASRARVATIGINPSEVEFLDRKGSLLSETERRLATLRSLGATDCESLTDSQVAAVVDGCHRYFSGNPYVRWFGPFDEVLRAGLGVSYHEGSACHLDLVQWATAPVWGRLTRTQQRTLLAEGVPHLRAQLATHRFDTVVVNGRQVWNQLIDTGLVEIVGEEKLPFGSAGTTNNVRIARGCDTTFLGWTLNLQSSPGVRKVDRERLAAWLRDAVVTAPTPADPSRTSARSKTELVGILREWLRTSNSKTLASIDSYGGRSVIELQLGGDIVVVNADTSRAAVAAFVAWSDAHGAEAPWRVLRSRSGKVNKVEFTDSGKATPGWYCYVRPPFEAEGTI